MAPKIFATGVTGYIGGTALDTIIATQPDYEITALVRSDDKGSQLTSKYPSVKTVIGNLDSTDLIESESSKADIVLHFANCDHVPSAKAITAGLRKSGRDVYLIHTSGAAILPDITKPELFGTAPTADEDYGDIKSIVHIASFPETGHLHRDVDTIVFSTPENVRTAIVCPPTIYGAGTGAGNVRSNQIPGLTRAIIERGRPFAVGQGEAVWNNVHVVDLADLYLKLTEAAAARDKGSRADWNNQGYYFAENGSHCWGTIAQEIGKVASERGLVKDPSLENLSVEEVVKIHPFGAVLWGSNSRGSAERARSKLGWTPKRERLEETLPYVVEQEAKALGKL